MHHATPYGVSAYRTIGIETGVAAADPLGLVVMLYDGAIQAVIRAETHLAQGEIEARGVYTSKALDIVNQGLMASLDVRVGGALAEGLWSLYEYMGRRLVAANMSGDVSIYVEVRTLLADLRGSWIELRRTRGAPIDGGYLGGHDVDSQQSGPARAFGRSITA